MFFFYRNNLYSMTKTMKASHNFCLTCYNYEGKYNATFFLNKTKIGKKLYCFVKKTLIFRKNVLICS